MFLAHILTNRFIFKCITYKCFTQVLNVKKFELIYHKLKMKKDI
jgi:hypothetical protein